ncbi:MAG: HTTM domain-containing protein [Polyangiaceae bacterium]|nr:HTTM domain-containing protein [Polyangiaceae bacterium]
MTTTQPSQPENGALPRLRTFFFSETPGHSAALFRIAFGLLITYYVITYLGWNLTRYNGPDGLLPYPTFQRYVGNFSVLSLSGSAAWLWTVWGLTLLSAVGYTLGFYHRASAAVLYIGLISIQGRNPYVINAAEILMSTLAFLSVFAPLGQKAALTPAKSTSIVFGQRLVQIQLTSVYMLSVIHKLGDSIWRDGTALGLALQIPSVSRFPGALGVGWLTRGLTFGTLVFETFFFLAFFKKTRPLLLVCGILLHLSIEVLFIVPLFSITMLTTYLLFLTDDEAHKILLRLRLVPRGETGPQRTNSPIERS